MSYKLENSGKIIQVTLFETLDLSSTNNFKEEFDRVMSSDITSVLINASSLDYIDSSGVASLLFIRKICQRFGCKLVFQSVSDVVLRVIELANLHVVLGLSRNEIDVNSHGSFINLNKESSAVPNFSDSDALAIFQSDHDSSNLVAEKLISPEIKPGSFT
jgi:anti-sigma B factor antagonist